MHIIQYGIVHQWSKERGKELIDDGTLTLEEAEPFTEEEINDLESRGFSVQILLEECCLCDPKIPKKHR